MLECVLRLVRLASGYLVIWVRVWVRVSELGIGIGLSQGHD